MQGTIINVQRGLYTVRTERETVCCTLRGKLFKESQTTKNLVVIGDEVSFQPVQGGRGVITEIHERRSRLVRRGAGSKGRHLEQIIAANIDLAILVFSVKDPVYNKNLMERYIVAARGGNIEPVICFNKIDLIDLATVEPDIRDFEGLGFRVLTTSTVNGTGIASLREILRDKTAVFAGSSGVGKSSLINSVLEVEVAKTGEVSSAYYKGRHTTTSSSVFDLPWGGKMIDVPGMREFGLIDDGTATEEAFSDIEELSANCRFRDCKHLHEPGCAVKAAVAEGKVDERRYRNYLKLLGRRL